MIVYSIYSDFTPRSLTRFPPLKELDRKDVSLAFAPDHARRHTGRPTTAPSEDNNLENLILEARPSTIFNSFQFNSIERVCDHLKKSYHKYYPHLTTGIRSAEKVVVVKLLI